MPETRQSEIEMDTEQVDATLAQGTSEIEDTESDAAGVEDIEAGLDPATAERLRETHETTNEELRKSREAADTGREAASDFEDKDEEAARGIDSVDTDIDSQVTPSTSLMNDAAAPSQHTVSAPSGVLGGAGGQGDQAQMARSAMAQNAAWQQAMQQQQNMAAMNQMNQMAQQQAMEQSMQASQASTAEGEELSVDEIETILDTLVGEEMNAVESGDSGMTESGGSLGPTGTSGLSPDEVSFDKMDIDRSLSEEELAAYVNDAADLNGVPNDPEIRAKWENVMVPMAIAESGGNTNAANGWDSNAVGAEQEDGFPAKSSRGPWQTIPTTFAGHHMEGTSNSIYDPQASAASAMHYMMDRYDISPEGDGLDEFAGSRGIDVSTGNSSGGYVGY